MQVVMALVSGLLFGIGLILSGMTDPSKVIGFLDLAEDRLVLLQGLRGITKRELLEHLLTDEETRGLKKI